MDGRLQRRNVRLSDIVYFHRIFKDVLSAELLGFTDTLSWFETLIYILMYRDTLYVFTRGSRFIGYVRINTTKAVPEISIAVLLEERNKGYGAEIYRIVTKEMVTCAQMEILNGNAHNIYLATKAGFKLMPFSNNKYTSAYFYAREE